MDHPNGESERVTWFLEAACPDHHIRGGPAHVMAQSTAMRLLDRFPAIAKSSIATAAVCGDVPEVARILAARPRAAIEKSGGDESRSDPGRPGDLFRNRGPKGWEPLLYLCFARLPLESVSHNAVVIARMLLDHGADPNAYFMAGDSRYTPLVGVIGEGEENRPPHPQRDALVNLLLERGTEPYDMQVVYDLHFHGNMLWFLKLIHQRSLELGRKPDWDDPEWTMLDMGGYGSGARWHLDVAVKNDDYELADWLLTHGANPNASPARDRRFPQRSLYEEAMLRGHLQIAELLVEHGAVRTDAVLGDGELFARACLSLDADSARAHLAEHPGYLTATEPLFTASRRDRRDVVSLLLDLGMSPDTENEYGERALHIAAYHNALAVAKLLIDRGADADAVEKHWGNTPLGGAIYHQHQEMIDLLSHYSRDVVELAFAGKIDRLREVLTESPDIARQSRTPLMWLPPEDESLAMRVAELLIDHGADPSFRDREGMTAADRAERLAMFNVAELLRRYS